MNSNYKKEIMKYRKEDIVDVLIENKHIFDRENFFIRSLEDKLFNRLTKEQDDILERIVEEEKSLLHLEGQDLLEKKIEIMKLFEEFKNKSSKVSKLLS